MKRGKIIASCGVFILVGSKEKCLQVGQCPLTVHPMSDKR